MSMLSLCEKYFGTRDIYALLNIEKNASEKYIKKAYYKLSLQVHPDRVGDREKEDATEKFKILSKLYQILTDSSKRALYDEQGIIDDDDDDDVEIEGKLGSWLELWKKLFKPLTEEDISNYQKSYVGSELERNDIKKAYVGGKGCINHMMNVVPFLKIEDEPRLQEIVKEMIDANEVPKYDIFLNEPSQKRSRRHKKYARESKEAEEIKKKLSAKRESNLEKQIMERSRNRESSFNSLMDKLLEKYGGEDNENSIDLKLGKSSKKKKSTPLKKGKKVDSVKSGKVQKRKK